MGISEMIRRDRILNMMCNSPAYSLSNFSIDTIKSKTDYERRDILYSLMGITSDGYIRKIEGKYPLPDMWAIKDEGRNFSLNSGYKWRESKSILKIVSPFLIPLLGLIVLIIVNRREIISFFNFRLSGHQLFE